MKFAELGPCPVPAYQNLNEFGHLWEFIETRSPRRLLEIGSLFGGTLWYWSQLPTLEQLVTVDLPSDWDEVAQQVRDGRSQWSRWMPRNLEFHDIEADSHSPQTLQRVLDVLGRGCQFDVAFIDGDHSEEGVRRDFDLYSGWVKPGGVIAFHDTIPNGTNHQPGVVALCAELKWKYPSVEFFDPDGVGICAFVV